MKKIDDIKSFVQGIPYDCLFPEHLLKECDRNEQGVIPDKEFIRVISPLTLLIRNLYINSIGKYA